MDFKVKIYEALDQLERVTGKSSTNTIRANIKDETNQSKLFLKLQVLREELNKLVPDADKIDVSFTMGMPDGSKRIYPNLATFLADKQTQADLKKSYAAPGKPALG